MICTCLPTVRLILVQACPQVFSTNASRDKSEMGYGNGYSRNSNYIGHKQIELSSVEANIADAGEKRPPNPFGVFARAHLPPK